jgi:hypothetical protein
MANDRFWRILLQKSKVASVRIFGETLKRAPVDDSDNLGRATEVAMSFACGDEVPQISTRKPRLRLSEFLTPSAKRLLQNYRREAAVGLRCPRWRRPRLQSQACNGKESTTSTRYATTFEANGSRRFYSAIVTDLSGSGDLRDRHARRRSPLPKSNHLLLSLLRPNPHPS